MHPPSRERAVRIKKQVFYFAVSFFRGGFPHLQTKKTNLLLKRKTEKKWNAKQKLKTITILYCVSRECVCGIFVEIKRSPSENFFFQSNTKITTDCKINVKPSTGSFFFFFQWCQKCEWAKILKKRNKQWIPPHLLTKTKKMSLNDSGSVFVWSLP